MDARERGKRETMHGVLRNVCLRFYRDEGYLREGNRDTVQ